MLPVTNEGWKAGSCAAACVCVCVHDENTLFMCPALGAKTWIKGSGRPRICLRFVIVSAQTVKCVKLRGQTCQTRDPSERQREKGGCWEIQEAGSCFPSLTYGRSRRGTELWKHWIRQRERCEARTEAHWGGASSRSSASTYTNNKHGGSD